MKKLIILAAALLFGVGSVFGQGAWEVKVTWSYPPGADCTPSLLPSNNYGIAVTLDIYDVANDQQVTDPNPVNTTGLGATTTTFTSAQVQVEDYCDDSHEKTPSFTVKATVAFVELSTQAVFCYAIGEATDRICDDFSNGDVVVTVVFN